MTARDSTTELRVPVRRARPAAAAASGLPWALRPRVWLTLAGVALVSWLGYEAYDSWRLTRVTIRFRANGQPVTGASLEFFRFDDQPAAASPTAKLGELRADAAEVVVDSGVVPREVLLRAQADGYGAAFAYVRLGRAVTTIEFGLPAPFSGRVVTDGDHGASGVASAVIRVFGGGSRGVLLAQTTTAADGSFAVAEVAENIDYLTLRVLAPGFSVLETEWFRSEPLPDLQLLPTRPARGIVVAPPGVAVEGIELRVHNLPGVSTRTAVDGTFELDHLPESPTICAIVAAELPPELTHLRCVARSGGSDVRLELMRSGYFRGRVIDRATRTALPNVKVFHRNGPAGMEIVECDERGRFEIGRVPTGVVRLYADLIVEVQELSRDGHLFRRKKLRQGWIDLDLDDRSAIDDIVLAVD